MNERVRLVATLAAQLYPSMVAHEGEEQAALAVGEAMRIVEHAELHEQERQDKEAQRGQ